MAAPRDPVVTTLRSVKQCYLGAVGGGGDIAKTDALEAGPWEQWTIVTWDDGRVSLQASGGPFLTAVPDGTVEVRATEANEWERFDIEVRDVGVAFLSSHGTYLPVSYTHLTLPTILRV